MLKVTYLSIDQVPITSLTLFNLDLEQEPPIPQNEAPGRRRHLDGGQQWSANRRVVHHHHHCHPPLPPPSQISQHSYLWSPDDHPKHCLEYFPTPAPPKIDLVTNHNKIHLATPIP